LKDKKKECVIIYASKGLSVIQQIVHPMEGEYYALIWGYAFLPIFASKSFYIEEEP
jgi:hypothetical protein